jgi:hypothetical protein
MSSGGRYHLVTTCSVIGSSMLSSGSGPFPWNGELEEHEQGELTVGRSRANPKSVILSLQSRETKRFPGFKSLEGNERSCRGERTDG